MLMTVSTPHGQAKLFRLALFIKGFVLVLMTSFVVAWYLDVAQISGIKNWVMVFCEQATTQDLLLLGLIYAVLLSLPFIPGVELGILIMVIFGKAGILFAYLCTVAGLSLAYMMGWWLCKRQAPGSPACMSQKFDAHTIQNVLSKTASGRFLYRYVSTALLPLLRQPYVMVGLLFNLPGNIVLGGGGGIALLGGASGKLQWQRFVLTVMIATSPVPALAVLGVISFN